MSDASRTPQRRPWWQTTRTVRQGYWIAGIFLVIGVTNLITFPGGGSVSKWIQLSLGVWCTLLGTMYLTTAIALRRRQRRIPDLTTGHEANTCL